ncbi:hypothetical protein F183_A10370 [Bryobacterales bacterium F-183]|nr:hypothetical protein F183_A10370 [Bryobacterales bacterium F-183]
MTLRQAVDAAMKQNPDIALARLDEQKARYGVRVARDPFSPRLYAGSGIGYSWGIPQSVEGATPSIATVKGLMSIYNRPQSFRATQAKEQEHGAEIEVGRRQEEVAYRTASLFLAAEQNQKTVEYLRKQVDGLAKASGVVATRVAEGRELPIEKKKAELAVAKTRHRLTEFEGDQLALEADLAMVLGMNAGDRVQPAREERTPLQVPANEEESIAQALAGNKQIKGLESQIHAKSLEVKSYLAERYPKIDFVSSYALLARFNGYDQFFNKFQRHNTQVGLSISVPLLVPPGAKAYAMQAETDVAKLRNQVNQVRSKVSADIREAYIGIRKAESARDVAKLDLDVTRDQVGVVMARYEEGRALLKDLEEARVAEDEKWVLYFASQNAVERARLELLRHSGSLMAALQ